MSSLMPCHSFQRRKLGPCFFLVPICLACCNPCVEGQQPLGHKHAHRCEVLLNTVGYCERDWTFVCFPFQSTLLSVRQTNCRGKNTACGAYQLPKGVLPGRPNWSWLSSEEKSLLLSSALQNNYTSFPSCHRFGFENYRMGNLSQKPSLRMAMASSSLLLVMSSVPQQKLSSFRSWAQCSQQAEWTQ